LLYIDIISSLLDPRLVDPGSTLILVGAQVHTVLIASSVKLKRKHAN